jgi:hypothetical protein
MKGIFLLSLAAQASSLKSQASSLQDVRCEVRNSSCLTPDTCYLTPRTKAESRKRGVGGKRGDAPVLVEKMLDQRGPIR